MKAYYLNTFFLVFVFIILSCQSSKNIISDNDQRLNAQLANNTEAQSISSTSENIQIVELSHTVPTSDMIYVSLNIRAFWKVTHSIKYHKNVSSYDDTIHLVSNITEEAGRIVVITHKLRDLMKKEGATIEYSRCNRNTELEIMKNANQKLFAVGIEIVDIEARARKSD